MADKFSQEKVLRFLSDQHVMSLAVTGPQGPISAVLLYIIDNNFNISFVTHRISHKAKALSSDNRVSLSIWEFKKMHVQIAGIAEEITKQEEILAKIDDIMEAADDIADFWPPILQFDDNDYVVYTIKPSWVRVLDLSTDNMMISGNPFQTFEFKS